MLKIWIKIQPQYPEKSVSILQRLQQDIPGFHTMLAETVSAAVRNHYAVRNVRGLQMYTANSARSATTAAQTSLKKSVQQDSVYLMFAMAVNKLVNVR